MRLSATQQQAISAASLRSGGARARGLAVSLPLEAALAQCARHAAVLASAQTAAHELTGWLREIERRVAG